MNEEVATLGIQKNDLFITADHDVFQIDENHQLKAIVWRKKIVPKMFWLHLRCSFKLEPWNGKDKSKSILHVPQYPNLFILTFYSQIGTSHVGSQFAFAGHETFLRNLSVDAATYNCALNDMKPFGLHVISDDSNIVSDDIKVIAMNVSLPDIKNRMPKNILKHILDVETDDAGAGKQLFFENNKELDAILRTCRPTLIALFVKLKNVLDLLKSDAAMLDTDKCEIEYFFGDSGLSSCHKTKADFPKMLDFVARCLVLHQMSSKPCCFEINVPATGDSFTLYSRCQHDK